MPIINHQIVDPELVSNALEEVGVLRNNISSALNKAGAGIPDIAETIATQLKYGDNGSIKLKAAQLAAEMHGINRGANADNRIIFAIQGDSINLNNLFKPERLG